MSAVKRVVALIQDHYHEHGENPRRVCVSKEVARELDAEMAAASETYALDGLGKKRPSLLATGDATWVLGVLVVVDLDDQYVVDIREL